MTFFEDIQYLSKESDILFCSITHANLGQFSKPGTDLEVIVQYIGYGHCSQYGETGTYFVYFKYLIPD